MQVVQLHTYKFTGPHQVFEPRVSRTYMESQFCGVFYPEEIDRRSVAERAYTVVLRTHHTVSNPNPDGDGHKPSHHARQCRPSPAALWAPPIHTVIAIRSMSCRHAQYSSHLVQHAPAVEYDEPAAWVVNSSGIGGSRHLGRNQSAAAASLRHPRGKGAPLGPKGAALSQRVGLWSGRCPRGLQRARALSPFDRTVPPTGRTSLLTTYYWPSCAAYRQDLDYRGRRTSALVVCLRAQV
eukprot:scaffold16014_cov62-Phaeocystis_antarctica.AAC.1